MEGFSQSRGDDDLFDDEFTPIEQPQPLPSQNTTSQTNEVSPAGLSIHTGTNTDASSPTTRTQPPVRGRGRGARNNPGFRGSDRKGAGGLNESKFAGRPSTKSSIGAVCTTQEKKGKPYTTPKTADTPEESKSGTSQEGKHEQSLPINGGNEVDVNDTESPAATTTTAANPAPANAPTGPSKVPAVRGDRTATGGVRKPKLTEEELTAKLAAAKERSLELAAAHARAQADAADFEERERIATEKRQKDMANRRVLEGERERNRARKMAGLSGREWDAEKKEEDLVRGQRRRGGGPDQRYRNGGGPEENDLKMYEWNEERSGNGARGRRGYGRSGRGRGGRDLQQNSRDRPYHDDSSNGQRHIDVAAETDFPSLPASKPDTNTTAQTRDAPQPIKPAIKSIHSSGSMADDGGGGTATRSWAEQVESNEVAKAASAHK